MGVFSQCAKRGPPPSYEFYPETPFLVFALFTTSNTVMEATGTQTITLLVFVPKKQKQKIVLYCNSFAQEEKRKRERPRGKTVIFSSTKREI